MLLTPKSTFFIINYNIMNKLDKLINIYKSLLSLDYDVDHPMIESIQKEIWSIRKCNEFASAKKHAEAN